MTHPFTFPAVAGALLASVALGIHLGESAIGLINPIHFQGAAVHPRDRGAAIDPNEIRPRPTVHAGLYGWEEGHAARAADCGDCAALAPRDLYAAPVSYSAEVPYFGSLEETRAAERRVRRAIDERYAEARLDVPEVERHREAVVRYASYPVEAEARDEAAEADGYPDYKSRDVWLDGSGADADRDSGYRYEP